MAGHDILGQAAAPSPSGWLQTVGEWEPLISGLAGLVTIVGVVYAVVLWLRRERREAGKVEAVVNHGVLEVANRSSRTIWQVALLNEQVMGTESVDTPNLDVIRPDDVAEYQLEADIEGPPTIRFQVGGGDRYLWTPRCRVLTKCTRGPTRREHILMSVWPNAVDHITPRWRHRLLGRDGEGVYVPVEDLDRHMRDVRRKQRWDPRV